MAYFLSHAVQMLSEKKSAFNQLHQKAELTGRRTQQDYVKLS